MLMKSSRHLRTEIALRSNIERLQVETGDSEEEWGRLVRRRNLHELAGARSELAAIGHDLEWEFDGQGIFSEGKILVRRLENILIPLGQAMRGTARDIMFVEGQPDSTASVAELAEPVVTGTFANSFGIKFARSPVAIEQANFFGNVVFDRMADRVLQILQASILPDPGEDLAQSLNGLRQYTLTGWRRLSDEIAKQGVPSKVRWRGETVVTVTPLHAARLSETILQTHATEESRTVIGVLQGGDLDSGTFHIETDPGDPERERHYRGRAEPESIGRINGIPFGALVRAELTVITTDTPLWERPKETYVLRLIELGGPGDQTLA
jgi:hypothetical protein